MAESKVIVFEDGYFDVVACCFFSASPVPPGASIIRTCRMRFPSAAMWCYVDTPVLDACLEVASTKGLKYQVFFAFLGFCVLVAGQRLNFGKIILCGPAASGKTTFCSHLDGYFDTASRVKTTNEYVVDDFNTYLWKKTSCGLITEEEVARTVIKGLKAYREFRKFGLTFRSCL